LIQGGGPAALVTALRIIKGGGTAVVVECGRYDEIRAGEHVPPKGVVSCEAPASPALATTPIWALQA
jgi:hypothetical protein